MSFEKVADTPATVDAEYHNTIANNGKIWLFSKKCKSSLKGELGVGAVAVLG